MRKIIFLALLFALCVSVPELKAEGHALLKVSGGVREGYGTVAWSGDGSKIAFIARKVRIFDAESAETETVDVVGAYYLVWAGTDELAVLFERDGKQGFAWVDAGTLSVLKTDMPVRADAVYPAGGRTFLAVSSKAVKMSIGEHVGHEAYMLDMNDGSARKLYSESRVQPRYAEGEEYTRGWVQAGPSPLDGSLILMEYIDPPALSPYLRVNLLSSTTGRKRELSVVENQRFGISGSWSPDGRRFALANSEGRLRIMGLDGRLLGVDDGVVGAHPAWNPAGSAIFFGGYLLNSDGSGKRRVLDGAAGARAVWSPDGASAAILLDGRLSLLRGIRPRFVHPDAPLDGETVQKLRLLGELWKEGLLTDGQYDGRHDRIIRKWLSAE